jgi:hypothetical protein
MRYTREAITSSSRLDMPAIIGAGLALRELGRTHPDIAAGDFIGHLGDVYSGWAAEFIETILDLVERDRRVARRFRRWRRAVHAAMPRAAGPARRK